ncbi:helix-turn-helix domain-containing protein [Metapseudomonas otitidis]|uniref:DNA-binding protein n=1 Tax=Metapseudomonas otitidis TaxID=319939 RepID=A0A679GHR0_9GAMM|nr:helix-turn-helix domain-containing protein [Pseudomonas otitidis]BCA30153.1 DNA-binding protein [Pseudomonas otitidis]
MTNAAVALEHSKMAVGPEEAARLTGTTRQAIYKAFSGGQLASFKLGKRRLILVGELEAWLKRMAKENRK